MLQKDCFVAKYETEANFLPFLLGESTFWIRSSLATFKRFRNCSLHLFP